MNNRILLFNPKSAVAKHRIPNSILQIAASINGQYDWVVVDGNCESDPYGQMVAYLKAGNFRYVGFTVMPGPQLRQAIPFAKALKRDFPGIVMIWGGYFPTNHCKVVLSSGTVDYVIMGPGDRAFPRLIDALENGHPIHQINNLAFFAGGNIVKTPKEDLMDQDLLEPLPYEKLNSFYRVDRHYLGKTYLGKKTAAYHSSLGCPFSCSFCAVVPIYQARWKAKSASLVYRDVKFLKDRWGADSIEFHDNNFFVSEKRVIEFSTLMKHEKMNWWGMARIDTMDKFKDSTLALMREAGCRIIFFGAESGNDSVLKQLNKGGTQTGNQIAAFAARMKRFDIVPEYSFVLGTPAPSEQQVEEQIDFEIEFIRKIKRVNPRTEIVLYTYSPVPTEGSDLYNDVLARGFRFPQKLDDWTSPQWETFDLRKNPLTPWLKPGMVDKIRNFETVLNGYYPTLTDTRLSNAKRKLLKVMSGLRYKLALYSYPYEIKLLHRVWKYRQPEIQGF